MTSKRLAEPTEDVPSRSDSEPVSVPRPRPRWWLLYGMIPLALLLLLGARAEASSGGWREVADCVASLAVIGGMAAWLRLNRNALNLTDAKASQIEMHGR